MIRTGIVWGVARAEARLCRRLVRYWIFVGLAVLITFLTYGWYAFLHRQFSAYSATAAMFNPRYLLGFMGFWSMTLFLIGLVFLGYEVRARDVRERIVDVVDSLPCSNLEFIFGKFLGLLIPYWIPVAVIAGVLALVGWIAGAPVEPLSLVTFTVLQSLPAFTVALGVIFTVTLLLRHRGLAAVGLLVAFVGLMTAGMLSPTWLAPLTDVTGAFTVPFPSDIVPVESCLGCCQKALTFAPRKDFFWGIICKAIKFAYKKLRACTKQCSGKPPAPGPGESCGWLGCTGTCVSVGKGSCPSGTQGTPGSCQEGSVCCVSCLCLTGSPCDL